MIINFLKRLFSRERQNFFYKYRFYVDEKVKSSGRFSSFDDLRNSFFEDKSDAFCREIKERLDKYGKCNTFVTGGYLRIAYEEGT